MSFPTDEDRALWRKAAQTPDQITEEERRHILRLVDPETKIANALKISGITPEELENKILTKPESITEPENNLLRYGYHLYAEEYVPYIYSMDLSEDDRQAQHAATNALETPHEQDISHAALLRSNFFFEERSKKRDATMTKVADEMHQPCKWVRNLIDLSLPIDKQTRRWGFVVLRDTTAECSEEDWDAFIKQFDEFVFLRGVMWMSGGSIINQTRQMCFGDEVVNASDREGLCRVFQETASVDSLGVNPHILNNTFLLIDSEVMKSLTDSPTPNPWIWAYEANFAPSANPIVLATGEKYEGRMKVALNSLFSWFYAVRKEEIYSMELLWERGQQQPDQAWFATTTMGRYHGPLILIERGTHWPFNTYEFGNEA